MKKIWTVESGEYSDHRVHGIFSSHEKAQAACSYIGSKAAVVENTLDPGVDQLRAGLHLYEVWMDRDGNELHATDRHEVDWSEEDDYLWGWEKPVQLRAMVWAKDRKSAIKITNERRLRIIADNKWTSCGQVIHG